jgi:hypothetical protein
MKIEPVEIFSDASNAAVMRHPTRKFPGVLVQGDTLHILVKDIEGILSAMPSSSEASQDLKDIHGRLDSLLLHYKSVLLAHSMPLPFNETNQS